MPRIYMLCNECRMDHTLKFAENSREAKLIAAALDENFDINIVKGMICAFKSELCEVLIRSTKISFSHSDEGI